MFLWIIAELRLKLFGPNLFHQDDDIFSDIYRYIKSPYLLGAVDR